MPHEHAEEDFAGVLQYTHVLEELRQYSEVSANRTALQDARPLRAQGGRPGALGLPTKSIDRSPETTGHKGTLGGKRVDL